MLDLKLGLNKQGIFPAIAHGEMTLTQRKQQFNDISQNQINHIIASNTYANGIHIPLAKVVVNFTVPDQKIIYHNRITRVGLFGSVGLVISLAWDKDITKISKFGFGTVIGPQTID